MKKIAFFCLLFFCGILFAQDGSNVIYNGDFQESNVDFVNGWSINASPETLVKFDAEGDCYLSIQGSPDPKVEVKSRQRGLTLVPGENYKLSARIRTSGFSAENGSIVLINKGWFASEGLKSLPADTDGWQTLETVFPCPDSSDTSQYEIVILTIAQKGRLEVTDVSLVPLTGKGIFGSRLPAITPMTSKTRLIPWTPSFNEVPLKNPVISFVWYGGPVKGFKPEKHHIRAVVPAVNFTSEEIAFTEGVPFQVNLSGVSAGLQTITMQVEDADGKPVYQESFLVNLRDIPTVAESTQGVRLNNLVTELVNAPVTAGQEIPVVTCHDQWLYITLMNSAQKEFSVMLDGVDVTDKVTGLPEAFRMVPAGRHTVSATCEGTMVVRVVPELFSCGMLEGPKVTEFPPFDWEFAKKWALPAVNSCNRGFPAEEILQANRESGRVWTGNLNAVTPPSVQEMTRRMDETLPKVLAKFDGVSADELFYDFAAECDNYCQALKKYDYDRSKLFYTWVTNMPRQKVLDTDFIATTMNASHGRGRLLREAYIPANALTEAEARADAEKDMLLFFQLSKELYPDYMRRAGFILGNFNQLNVITLEHRPQVDYKYYLDMQMNILANDPLFDGLGMTGYWGTHYCDEEMYRWSHALLRHYAVEGKTAMLSEEYGFSYLPGHITNNDFEDGLNGWTVEAAEEGSVTTASFKGYHDANQDRWGEIPNGVGDSFCVMHAVEGKPNRVSQVATGLVPGKQYMLLFSVGDYDDLKAQRFNPRKVGFQAILEEAEINESFVFVDGREKGNYERNNGVARQNLHRIIFTPKSDQVKITFTDETATPGENLMFNYVQLKPFFPKGEY